MLAILGQYQPSGRARFLIERIHLCFSLCCNDVSGSPARISRRAFQGGIHKTGFAAARRGGDDLPARPGPGRIRQGNLATLVVNATGLLRDRISGPGWIDSAWFEVAATTPPNATNEEFREMFLNLLEERFAFKYHREKSRDSRVRAARRTARAEARGRPFGHVSPAAVRQALQTRRFKQSSAFTLAGAKVAITTAVIDHAERTPAPN